MPFPAGHVVTADEYANGPVAKFFTTAGTFAGSTTSETAMSAWGAGSSSNVLWRTGHLYRVDVSSGWVDSSSEVAVVNIRARKTINNTGAQQLGFWKPCIPAIGAANAVSTFGQCYVKNVSGADITSTPGLTIQRITGAGTLSLFGDANIECSLTVSDMGLTTDTNLTALASQAVAIV